MSFRATSLLGLALVLCLLLALSTPVASQSGSAGTCTSASTASTPFAVYPILRLGPYWNQIVNPQYVQFDPQGRLVVEYSWGSSLAAVYDVSPSLSLTLDSLYPWGDGFSGSWSAFAIYQNTSGEVPLTVVFGPTDHRLVTFTAQSDNLTEWLAPPGQYPDYSSTATLSYPGLPSSGWSFTAVALDQQLGVIYVAVNPCNAVFQYQIVTEPTGQYTTFTQKLAITGSNPLLNQPVGLVVDAESYLYVADSNNRVVQFNSAGEQLAVLIEPSSSFVSYPSFQLDPVTQDFLVLDTQHNAILRWSRDGSQCATFQLANNGLVSSLAVNEQGDFFVLDANAWAVTVVPADQAAQLPARSSNSSSSSSSSSSFATSVSRSLSSTASRTSIRPTPVPSSSSSSSSGSSSSGVRQVAASSSAFTPRLRSSSSSSAPIYGVSSGYTNYNLDNAATSLRSSSLLLCGLLVLGSVWSILA